jgi:protein TonB
MSGALAMHLPVRRPACPDPSPQGHQARIQGIVRVEAVIGKDGHVTDEKLISGHPLLVPQAEQCIKQWVFRPMTLNGEPVEVVTELELTFPLAK